METVSFRDIFPDIISTELFKEIESNSSLKTFNDGEIIIDVGLPIKFIPLLLKGTIKVIREDDEGNELLMYYLKPGDTCAMSLTCCMSNHQSEIRAESEGDVMMLALPVNFMDEWMLKYPDWKNFVMNNYRKRFEELFSTIDQIAFKNMDDRLKSYLKAKFELKQTNQIKITHQEIANELNTSREVISRLLKQMEKNSMLKLSRHAIEFVKL